MALLRNRKIEVDDINFKMAEVASKGMLVTHDTANPDFVQVQASVSGVIGTKVAGMLMMDVVDKDFNAVPVNFQRLETGLSGLVRLAKLGEIGTDQIAAGSLDPSGVPVFGPGSGVYLADAGLITHVQDSTQNERIGTALAAADSNNFVRIYLNVD
jgi:hypothetical protein